MKNIILALVLSCTSFLSLASSPDEQPKRSIKVSAQLDLFSKSIWHGWDLNNNKPTYIPYVAVDLFQTGLEVAYWASIPVDRNLKVNDVTEFYLKYHATKLEGDAFQFNFHGFIDYNRSTNDEGFAYTPYPQPNNPDAPWVQPVGMKQLWKLNLGVAFENLIPLAGSHLVPAVDMFHIKPAGDAFFTDGSVWEFSLNYNHPVTDKLAYGLKFNAIYHDKIFDVNAWGAYVFSNTWKYQLNKNLALQAGINYQVSPEDLINTENEFWGQAGLAVSF